MNHLTTSMKGVTSDQIRLIVLDFLLEVDNTKIMYQIVLDELSRGNRIIEFTEPVEVWDLNCFILFASPLKEINIVTDSISYRELLDTHYWFNEYKDANNKIIIVGNKGKKPSMPSVGDSNPSRNAS